MVSYPQKVDALTRILEVENFEGMIVFVRTKNETESLAEKLRARGFSAAAINGDVVQDGRTSDMIFDVPTLIEHVSSVMTLLPGDVILTGTPEGVGPMSVGDEVEVVVDRLGTLTNKVVARD